MSTHTLPIATTTVPVGQSTFGPFAVGNNTQALLTIDRTVAGGLNSLTSASVLDVAIQSSNDGVNWSGEVEATWPAGIVSDRHGQVNSVSMSVSGINPAQTSVRLVATVTGPSSIAIAGSCVVS